MDITIRSEGEYRHEVVRDGRTIGRFDSESNARKFAAALGWRAPEWGPSPPSAPPPRPGATATIANGTGPRPARRAEWPVYAMLSDPGICEVCNESGTRELIAIGPSVPGRYRA